MDYKNTVMTDKQIGEVYGSVNVENWTPRTWEMPRRIAQAQAEISFKAGYEQRKKEVEMATLSLAELLHKHQQFGRKDVVEWIIERQYECKNPEDMAFRWLLMPPDEWRAKLEEWDIDG